MGCILIWSEKSEPMSVSNYKNGWTIRAGKKGPEINKHKDTMADNTQLHLHILGINPGSRSLGLAVLKYGVLADCRVKGFKEKWSTSKLDKLMIALTRFIQKHKITALALKKVHHSRSSKALESVVLSIERYAKRNKLMICRYSIDEIKEHIGNEQNLSILQLSGQITPSKNEVLREFNVHFRYRNKYYLTMFEAVVLSLACQNDFGIK